MATRNIQAFRLRSELIVDASKHHAEYAKAEKEVNQYGSTVKKTAKEVGEAFKGADAGRKWGADFGSGAVASITGSIKSLGTTLGSIIGTAIAPGIGTAVGSTIGSGLDAALEKVSGPMLELVKGGIQLNKEIERTTVEFTTFAGSEKQAIAYLEDLKKLSIETGTSFSWVMETSEHIYDLTGNLELTNKILKASIDHAADFGGKAETIGAVAEQLGLIAEKGSLASRELNKLYKLGIDARKYLAEATGHSLKEIDRLMKADRLRGDVAAKLIAEGLEREKGGFAARIAATTTYGKEMTAQNLLQIRSQEATKKFTEGLGDMYGEMSRILASPQAKDFVAYLDKFAGTLVDWTKKGIQAGVSIGGGIAEGLISGQTLSDLGSSFKKLGSWTTTTLKELFEAKSPSELMAREVGVPLGQGLGVGLVRGLGNFIKGEGGDALVDTLRGLLQDPRVQALLNTLIKSEGGALDIMAGGRHVPSGAKHPGEVVPRSQWMISPGTGGKRSSASGLLQETLTNWKAAEKVLGPLNFSNPEDQKLVALWLMSQRPGGLGALQSGDISRMMPLAAKDWTSVPGSTIGGGGQWGRAKWLGTYQAMLGGGGQAIKPTSTGAMPVAIRDIEGGAAQMLRGMGGTGAPTGPGSILGTIDAITKDKKDLAITYGVEDAAIVNVKSSMDQLIETTNATTGAMLDASMLRMRATTPLIDMEKFHADTSIALTKEYQKAAWDQLRVGRDIIGELAGAFGQVAGMVPSQQVGKKRGFFSKLLGFAAPFLSFIPGVGPILSTIAGAASSAIGGDYGAAITGIAGGFAKGGAFRRAPSSNLMPLGAAPNLVNLASAVAPNLARPRQFGGPVYRGQPYLVGERGPELFIPGEGGAIHPGDLTAVLHGLRQEIARLSSMPPEHVVMRGAHGIARAMDGDASLAEQYGRRLRLA